MNAKQLHQKQNAHNVSALNSPVSTISVLKTYFFNKQVIQKNWACNKSVLVHNLIKPVIIKMNAEVEVLFAFDQVAYI